MAANYKSPMTANYKSPIIQVIIGFKYRLTKGFGSKIMYLL